MRSSSRVLLLHARLRLGARWRERGTICNLANDVALAEELKSSRSLTVGEYPVSLVLSSHCFTRQDVVQQAVSGSFAVCSGGADSCHDYRWQAEYDGQALQA
jgi:hypothetical protein